MKKRNASFPINAWVLILFLTFLAFSVKPGEVTSPFRYAAEFIRGREWVASARTLEGRYAKAVDLQNANDLGIQSDMKVFLGLPAESTKAEALIDANKEECSGDASQAIAFEANGKTQVASQHSAVSPSIHFQLADSLIYMQASLNGSQPLWVILDTGSSFTVIDESVLKMLGLQFVGEGDAYGPGQGSTQKFAFANHTTLMFAGVNLGNQTVAALPLDWFSRELGRSVDGFLGSNIFQNYVVEIDYANQVLRLHDPATFSYSGSGQRLPLQFLWDNIPSVQAEVMAQDGTAIQGTFLIDSGATTAVWLTRAFSDAHPEFLAAEETIEVPNVVAVGGELSARLGRLPAVRLGTFEISMPPTQFSQNTSGILATPHLAGIIGAQMLRRFTVIFDYTHREMILEANEHFSEPSV
jgi:Aspartyl protease